MELKPATWALKDLQRKEERYCRLGVSPSLQELFSSRNSDNHMRRFRIHKKIIGTISAGLGFRFC